MPGKALHCRRSASRVDPGAGRIWSAAPPSVPAFFRLNRETCGTLSLQLCQRTGPIRRQSRLHRAAELERDGRDGQCDCGNCGQPCTPGDDRRIVQGDALPAGRGRRRGAQRFAAERGSLSMVSFIGNLELDPSRSAGRRGGGKRPADRRAGICRRRWERDITSPSPIFRRRSERGRWPRLTSQARTRHIGIAWDGPACRATMRMFAPRSRC